ncbi:MAG: hypothetical protein L0G96_21800 [Acinetobacter sp.]|nr:hypothetical protein [Acinetobacter sp.]
MLIHSASLSVGILTLTVCPTLGLKLIVNHVKVSRDHKIVIKKGKFNSEIFNVLKADGTDIQGIIRSSFMELSHKYNLNAEELAAWTFLFQSLECLEVKLNCATLFSAIFGRTIAMNGELRKPILSLLREFKRLAVATQNDSLSACFISDIKQYSL